MFGIYPIVGDAVVGQVDPRVDSVVAEFCQQLRQSGLTQDLPVDRNLRQYEGRLPVRSRPSESGQCAGSRIGGFLWIEQMWPPLSLAFSKCYSPTRLSRFNPFSVNLPCGGLR